MESRRNLAARVRDIAPFHVMEVQTAARALEAAGRSVIHMEIGEPDFPTPAPVLAAAQSRARRRRRLLHVGAGDTGTAGSHRAALCRSPRRPRGPRAGDRHGRVVGGAAAGDGARRRSRRAHPARGSRLSVQPAVRPHPRGRAGRHSGRARHRLPAVGRADRAPLDAAHARRADRLAVEPDRHDGAAGGDAAHRGDGRAPRRTPDRRRDLPRPVLRCRAEVRAVDRRGLRRRAVRRLQLFQVLQHDRMAPRLDRRAGAPRPRPRDAGAEPLHLAAHAVAARRARLLRARHAGDRRGAPAGVPRPPRFPGAGAARARLRHPGDAGRRLLRLRRQLALLARQPALLPRRAGGRGRGDHAGPRFRRRIASSDHVRFAYTIGMAKLEDGVARLGRYLRARGG